jgi:FixJ family two-component response regulator
MRQGALTFIEKPFGLSEISAQIRLALETDARWRQRWLRRRDARERLRRLTPAQRAVFDLLASGRSNKQIAEQVGLSLRAIEDRKARLIQSLQLNTIVDLFELAAAAEAVVPPHDRDLPPSDAPQAGGPA